MAVFCGAFAFGGARLAPGLEDRLAAIVGEAGEAVTTRSASGVLVHAELGIWADSAVRSDERGTAVVAGDPVFCLDGEAIGARPASIDAVARIAFGGQVQELEHAQGSHFVAALDTSTDRLVLAVAKLAVRPIYVTVHAGVLYAASGLWMLERLADVPKRCDWRGITETAAFGFALADRTAYLEIESLGSGQALTVTASGLRRSTVWDWRRPVPGLAADPADPLEAVERAFHRAVDDRLGPSTRALAFLSGGMDSRLLVARLRERGAEVDTLNFAPQGSADLVYGALAAKAMGTRHFEYGAGESPAVSRAMEAIEAWRAHRVAQGDTWAPAQRVLWSGEGGSVSLGHVYMSRAIAEAARRLGPGKAAEAIQQETKCRVSPRMFTPGYRALADLPLQGIREDLASSAALEPGRACHMFFMLNDQRRHMAFHYENVHRLKIDFHMPFFDGRALQTILGSDLDPFLGHRLYNRLFERLPFGLGQVPWQSYPGHEPCPVKSDLELRQQWSDGWFDERTLKAQRRAELDAMARRLRAPAVPSDVLARPTLSLALRLTRWGLRDYSYLLAGAKPFLAAHAVAQAR